MSSMMMNKNRELATLPIAPAVLTNLTRAGFMIIDDVSNLSSPELSKGANISDEQASGVLQKINDNAVPLSSISNSAWEILQKERESPSIVTFSESVDDMLDGGIPLAKITEFCGAPGTGKTQLCLQLCVDVQMPTDLGGLEGEAVYVDTEGSFVIDRLTDIAQAAVDHCQDVLTQMRARTDTGMSEFTVENILNGVHYFRCQDHFELAATLQQIPEIIGVHPKVKLLVVDNIASLVRQGFDDLLAQNQFVSSVGQLLVKVATTLGIAVVLTNQMTTKIDFLSNRSHLIPALGETWSHVTNRRIIFFEEGNHRRALLYKSPNKKETACTFQITTNGVRDVVDTNMDSEIPSHSSGLMESSKITRKEGRHTEEEDLNCAKRARLL